MSGQDVTFEALEQSCQAYLDGWRFDGAPSEYGELWLGEAFQSWMPSARQLVIRTHTGEEATVPAGTLLVKLFPDTWPVVWAEASQ